MRQTARTSGPTRAIGTMAIDFALGLTIFAGIAGFVATDNSAAFPAPPPPELTRMETAGTAVVPRSASRVQLAAFTTPPEIGPARMPSSPASVSLLLALSFATMTALNLAFWRHLRRAYASPRRGSWRRG